MSASEKLDKGPDIGERVRTTKDEKSGLTAWCLTACVLVIIVVGTIWFVVTSSSVMDVAHQYQDDPTVENGRALLAAIEEEQGAGPIFRDRDEIRKAKEIARTEFAANHQWELLEQTISHHQARFIAVSGNSDHVVDEVAEHYHGKLPKLSVIAGMRLHEDGYPAKAYQRFAQAALGDWKYGAFAKSVARHYGCTDLVQVWNEVTPQATSMIHGAPMEPMTPRMTPSEVANARIALRRDGTLPPISPACPLAEPAQQAGKEGGA